MDLMVDKAGLQYPMIYSLLLRPMIGRQLDALYDMEEFLHSDCQDIDYTVVRPPGLVNGPLSGLL
jgi:biliverdin reductase/flavin reductase